MIIIITIIIKDPNSRAAGTSGPEDGTTSKVMGGKYDGNQGDLLF